VGVSVTKEQAEQMIRKMLSKIPLTLEDHQKLQEAVTVLVRKNEEKTK
jgi:hypothetical protein